MAYVKFSQTASVEFAFSAPPAAKPANSANVPIECAGSLAGLASLAAPDPENEFEERTAIVEFDAGVPREWAEGFARLDPHRPPANVRPDRWLRFVDDVGVFLDQWAAKASALGWGPLDLYGCDARKPFTRTDRAGLLWLLNGGRIVALTADTAAIERECGVRQTLYRWADAPGRVMAWELLSANPSGYPHDR